jgi:hypothetical protein
MRRGPKPSGECGDRNRPAGLHHYPAALPVAVSFAANSKSQAPRNKQAPNNKHQNSNKNQGEQFPNPKHPNSNKDQASKRISPKQEAQG